MIEISTTELNTDLSYKEKIEYAISNKLSCDIMFNPDNNTTVLNIPGFEFIDITEAHIVCTPHGSQVRIRIKELQDNLTSWQDYYIDNCVISSNFKVVE